MKHKKTAIYNRIKNRIPIMVLIGSVFALTGCSSISYTPEQEDAIANYAADIVLKHDSKYGEDRIGEYETTTKPPESVPQQETQPNQGDGGNAGEGNGNTQVDTIATTGDITNAMKINGLSAEYVDYDVTDQYPSGDIANNTFVMKALENSKLLVVKFKLTNQTGQDVSINMMSDNRKYKGTVNDSKKYNSQLTLLMDALNTYEGTIANGSSQELVLVFQTQLDSKDDVNSLAISITDASGSEAVLKLK